jgi:hypothetical protein
MKEERVAVWIVAVAAVGWVAWGLLAPTSVSTDQTDASEGSGGGGWLSTIVGAISQSENVNPAYNNPLALGGTGDTGTSFGQGLGIYSSLSAGLAAGTANIAASFANHPQWTLSYWIARYTGNLDSNGNPIPSASLTNYTNNVSGALGVDPSTTLGDIDTGDDGGGDD